MVGMVCECGCGRETGIWKQTRRDRGADRGQPQRYLPLHHLKAVHDGLRFPPNERLCECGCRQPVNARNHRARFVKGHQLAEARSHKRQPAPQQPCVCGCGVLATRGKRYRRGHSGRGVLYGPERRLTADGYVQIRNPRFPVGRRFVLEHREVMEGVLGRRLARDEHVHHANHNKQDNRPENLVVVNAVAHGRLHAGWTPERRAATSERMIAIWSNRRAAGGNGEEIIRSPSLEPLQPRA